MLTQARGTLERASTTLTSLRPTLREVPAVGAPLREMLSRLATTQRQARPVVAQLRRQLPGLRRSLAGVPPIARRWVTAFRSLAELDDLQPIVRALRIYGVDFMVGVPMASPGSPSAASTTTATTRAWSTSRTSRPPCRASSLRCSTSSR